jgi:hypothetical protein
VADAEARSPQFCRGIHCRIDGLAHVRSLPLVDIGMPDEHPNYQMLDDYAFWFLNSW